MDKVGNRNMNNDEVCSKLARKTSGQPFMVNFKQIYWNDGTGTTYVISSD